MFGVLIIWHLAFWKWLVIGISIPMLHNFYTIIQEARAERREEAEYREIETKQITNPVIVEDSVRFIESE